MWKVVVIGMSVLLVALGCAPQEQAQRALIERMERGVSEVRAWQDQRQAVMEAFHRQQRRALDDAFDADAQTTPALDAEWVIEARRAYAAAMEAMWNAEFAGRASHQRAQENLLAVEEGLRRLAWMSALRENWSAAWGDVAKGVKREQD